MDLPLKILPLGIQTFDTIRNEGMVYVDKTELVHSLLSSYKRVFLSRPRRFGKSLLLSTISAFYSSRSELFQGLFVERLLPEKPLPVLHFDLSSLALSSHALELELEQLVDLEAQHLGVALTASGASARLRQLIRLLGKESQVVVLVDEYDKPITEAMLLSPEKMDERLAVMREFFGIFKSEDRYIRFCLITGVSRFSKVSIFSGINNLKDISFLPRYAALCGYTEGEITGYLREHVVSMAAKLALSEEEIFNRLREQYNGYRFSAAEETVFNPISVMNSLTDREISNYWFETATPTFLMRRIRDEKQEPIRYDLLENVELGKESPTLRQLSTADLLYQTGYLTIKNVNRAEGRSVYSLGWPNREVKDSFYECLLREYSDYRLEGHSLSCLSSALQRGDLTAFFDAFNTLLASIPYSLFISRESYYHSLLHMALQMCSEVTHSEKLTSQGRIDIVTESRRAIYIFECKLDAPADEALVQGLSRNYAGQYQCSSKNVYLVGVSFSSETRAVKEFKEVAVHPKS